MRSTSTTSKTTPPSKVTIDLSEWSPTYTREVPWRDTTADVRKRAFDSMFGICEDVLRVGQTSDRFELAYMHSLDGECECVPHEKSWRLLSVVVYDKYSATHLVVDITQIHCAFIPVN